MATKAPAKCVFGSMSTHNQCSRPTYVWMCVLCNILMWGLWRQKRRPNVSCIEFRTWGYGNKSGGQMFLRITCPHTTHAGIHTLIDSQTKTHTHAHTFAATYAHIDVFSQHTQVLHVKTLVFMKHNWVARERCTFKGCCPS